MSDIRGVIAYPVTPFTDDQIDAARLTQLVSTLVTNGANAIAPLGSTGESAYLSQDEWRSVVEVTLGAVAGRVPVIVGVSELTTAGTVARATIAQEAGADAVMVLPVSYWTLSDREIYAHYDAIGAALDIDIMAYNNPATSGVDMSPDLLVRLFTGIDRVTMVKESTGDINRMIALRELTEGALPFYNGSNPLVLAALRAGAQGWCTAAPCLKPQACLDLVSAAGEGRWTEAEAIYDELAPFLRFIVSRGLPTAIKAGLAILGAPAGVPRPPLLPLEPADQAELAGYLDAQLVTS